ncbi:hypothetical protein LCGC14_1241530 [marine sediment metagenome]|uniref:Nucleotide exchange factor GrpE n=1 Tax=marine sediment metagenome TaxID=412755 RepID=A0A0F9NMV0_9ZZZZ
MVKKTTINKEEKIEDEFDDVDELPTPTIAKSPPTSEIELMEQKLAELKAQETRKNLITDFPIWKEKIEKELAGIQGYLEKIHPVLTLHNQKFKELEVKKK